MFEVIPAVDIKGGKCVRLYQGKADREKVYFENPVEVAKRWEDEGARRIHVVDLDGAFEGIPKNIRVVEEITKSVSIPVQFGGGIRTLQAVEKLFSINVDRVIIGTVAVENPDLFKNIVKQYPEKIVLGIDAKDGLVTTKGWVEVTKIQAIELARNYDTMDIWGYVYTDISRDGTLSGPNFEQIERFAKSVTKPVIASGGVSSKEDIFKLKSLQELGVVGVIVGKALYEGKIKLKEVL